MQYGPLLLSYDNIVLTKEPVVIKEHGNTATLPSNSAENMSTETNMGWKQAKGLARSSKPLNMEEKLKVSTP